MPVQNNSPGEKEDSTRYNIRVARVSHPVRKVTVARKTSTRLYHQADLLHILLRRCLHVSPTLHSAGRITFFFAQDSHVVETIVDKSE